MFEGGTDLGTGLRGNMKNKLMTSFERMMKRKRKIRETINERLKNTAQIVNTRQRNVANFIMNIMSALGAYRFFENKPKALVGYTIENTRQLSLFRLERRTKSRHFHEYQPIMQSEAQGGAKAAYLLTKNLIDYCKRTNYPELG